MTADGTGKVTRISCDPSDPGHRAYVEGGRCWRVLLDGVVQPYAITADTFKGYVVRFKIANGRHVITNGAAERERVNGKVEIENLSQ